MSGPTEQFWDSAGVALVIFAMCVGLGCCSMMESFGNAKHSEATKPQPPQTAGKED